MYEASVLKELCMEWTDLYDWEQRWSPEDRKPKQLYTHSALADRVASWGMWDRAYDLIQMYSGTG